jgi:hypothetical protein
VRGRSRPRPAPPPERRLRSNLASRRRPPIRQDHPSSGRPRIPLRSRRRTPARRSGWGTDSGAGCLPEGRRGRWDSAAPERTLRGQRGRAGRGRRRLRGRPRPEPRERAASSFGFTPCIGPPFGPAAQANAAQGYAPYPSVDSPCRGRSPARAGDRLSRASQTGPRRAWGGPCSLPASAPTTSPRWSSQRGAASACAR